MLKLSRKITRVNDEVKISFSYIFISVIRVDPDDGDGGDD
jgi:hypothetical protein